MTRSTEIIRIPRLRAVVMALSTLVFIGVGVFLRRYRGADRTAMALGVLVGAGICLIAGVTWFQRRFGGRVMTRRRLWGIGIRCGALAGACTNGVGVALLAARWALDQQAGPAGDAFLQAFLRALTVLGVQIAMVFLAYVAVGAVVGGLVGFGIAQAIGVSAGHPAPAESTAAVESATIDSSRIES